MRIKIHVDEELDEDEILINCRQLDERILKAERLLRNLTKEEIQLVFFKDDKEYYLELNRILFFETHGDHILAHSLDDVFKVKYRLYELEEILPKNFIRVSKSSILNIDHIYSISRNIASVSLVEFQGSYKKLYVSRHYFKGLKDRLDERRSFNG